MSRLSRCALGWNRGPRRLARAASASSAHSSAWGARRVGVRRRCATTRVARSLEARRSSQERRRAGGPRRWWRARLSARCRSARGCRATGTFAQASRSSCGRAVLEARVSTARSSAARRRRAPPGATRQAGQPAPRRRGRARRAARVGEPRRGPDRDVRPGRGVASRAHSQPAGGAALQHASRATARCRGARWTRRTNQLDAYGINQALGARAGVEQAREQLTSSLR
jgi:hypothetical protein